MLFLYSIRRLSNKIHGRGSGDIGNKHYAGFMVKNWNPGPEIIGFYDYVETSWSFAAPVELEGKLTTTWGMIKKK